MIDSNKFVEPKHQNTQRRKCNVFLQMLSTYVCIFNLVMMFFVKKVTKLEIRFNNIWIQQPKLSSPFKTVISDFHCTLHV